MCLCDTCANYIETPEGPICLWNYACNGCPDGECRGCEYYNKILVLVPAR